MAIPSATVYKSGTFFTWFESFGQVYTVKKISSTRVLYGGTFSWINGNQSVNYFSCVNASTGEIDYTYNSGGTGFNGSVTSMFTDYYDSSKLIIVGSFTQYNGQTASGMIRLNSDGTKDNTFVNTGTTNGTIWRVKYFGGTLYMVGSFTTIRGVSSPKVAKLDRYGTVDTTFASNIGTSANGDIYAIGWLDVGTDVVLGGSFSSFNGNTRGNICKVNSSGTLQTTDSHFNNFIWDLEYPMDSSRLWVTGGFTSWTGNSGQICAQGCITQINASATNLTLSTSFTGNTGFNGSAWTVFPFSTNYGYIVTTTSTKYNGNDCGNIVCMNINGTENANKFGDTTGNVYGLDVSGYDFYGGRISRFDGTNFSPTPYTLRIVKIKNTAENGNPAPILTTAITGITQTTATGGGTIIGDGGLSITERGVCWSTGATPTISNPHSHVTGTTGTFTTSLTGLTAGTLYYVRAYATNSNGTGYGSAVSFTTSAASPAYPSGATCTRGYTTLQLNWGLTAGESDGIHITKWNGSSYVLQASLPSSATTYTLTGLTAGTRYIYEILNWYNSGGYGQNYFDATLPYGHTCTISSTNVSYYGGNDGDITITNIAGGYPMNYSVSIDNGANWYSTSGYDSIQFPSLTAGTYHLQIKSVTNPTPPSYTLQEDFGIITITQPALNLPSPFCVGDGFTDKYYTTVATCGNTDGTVEIVPPYEVYYTFTLIDSLGNEYFMDTGTTGTFRVPSGYYFLTATPKPAYHWYYGSAPCTRSWIPVEDGDSTMTLSVVIRGSTSSYIVSTGTGDARIYGDWTDSVTGQTHDYYLWKANGTNVLTVTGSTDPNGFVKTPLENGDYYGLIINENGCKTLSGLIHVEFEQSPFNLSGVKRVFVSEYKDDLDIEYWKTSDEDYYVEALDLLKFQSAKIKRITNANTWYSIPADVDTVFTQKMTKVRQGFIFNNSLTISFSPSTYYKWLATKTLLDKRLVVVFEDCNGNWWIYGYYNQGAEVRSYSRKSDYNYYAMEFVSNSGDKILTAVDYNNYVLPYIINS